MSNDDFLSLSPDKMPMSNKRSTSAHFLGTNSKHESPDGHWSSQRKGSMMDHMRTPMSKTMANMPTIGNVLGKIKTQKERQLKVIQANLAKTEKNNVIVALREFKEKRATKKAQEMIKLKQEEAKYKWEEKM